MPNVISKTDGFLAWIEGINVYLLIAGGDKSSQKQDIKQAKALWNYLKKAGAV